MKLPYQFPDPLKEAARRSDEFQRLPPDARLRQLIDVIETGLILIQHAPRSEACELFFQQREAQCRRVQRELFTRHGF